MRYLIFPLFSFILLISCQPNNELLKPEEIPEVDCVLPEHIEVEEVDCNFYLTEFNYVKERLFGNMDTALLHYYTFDKCGKVIQETHVHGSFEYLNYTSNFEYDEEGKVVKEIRNGILYRYVEWLDNTAAVYDNQCELMSEIIFENNNIVKFTDYFETNVTYTLEYDNMENLKSIKDNIINVPYEYMEFSTDVENPFHLLKSISALRFFLKPWMKYTHEIEKRNPHTHLDVTYSLAFFDLTYELDSLGVVNRIDHENHFIYTNRFSYN